MTEAKITRIIEDNYGFRVLGLKPAPRQFVAETWFAESENKQRFFVKYIDKQLFIPEVVASLPVLDAMHKAGIDRINWPILTNANNYYVEIDKAILVLFNAFDALQSYDYSEEAFGSLLAKIHGITAKIEVPIPTEDYSYAYKDSFESRLEGILSSQLVTDEVTKKLKQILLKYEKRIRFEYDLFQSLTKQMIGLDLPKVITHGDAGGNTLVKSPNDLYIIDWDSILLAPAERDTWIPSSKFFVGYNKVVPTFTPNKVSTDFYTFMYYFRSMAQYFDEIISEKTDEHRLENLHAIEHDFLEGWIKKFLLRVYSKSGS